MTIIIQKQGNHRCEPCDYSQKTYNSGVVVGLLLMLVLTFLFFGVVGALNNPTPVGLCENQPQWNQYRCLVR